MSVLTDIARYLHDQVGEGHTFTADDLARVTGKSPDSAERRLRDLPRIGWEFGTVKNDTTLTAGQYRLIKIGTHIWEAGQPRSVSTHTSAAGMQLDDLTVDQLRTLASWIRNGHEESVLENVWRTYQRLSPAAAKKVKADLFDRLIGD